MTDLDRLEIELGTARQTVSELESKIETVRSNRSIAQAREAFQKLGTDETLPALKILEQALSSWSQSESGRKSVGSGDTSEFVERLVAAINARS